MMIRNALIEDACSIKTLIQQLGYEINEKEVEKNVGIYDEVKGHVLVAEEKGEIEGFISGAYIPLFHAHGMMFRITALCIDENKRSLGIGRQLVESVELASKKNGCFYVEVTSGAHRKEDAHPFYVKLGYSIYEGKRFRKVMES